MSYEAPTTPSPIDKEQTLKDLSSLEEKLREAKLLRNELAGAIEAKDEPKQEELNKKIGDILSQCRSLKRKIEGKADTAIEADYTYTEEIKDEETGETTKTERTERISLDIEKELEFFAFFYTTHTIETPPNFQETILDIWHRNREEIEKAIKEKGFNTILLIPPTLPNRTDLNTKMTGGYATTYEWTELSIIEENPQAPRIVLLHNTQELNELPILKETLGKPAGSFNTETLTLSDYLILQRKIFEETGEHIDANLATWLPGSTVPTSSEGDFRVVFAEGDPDYSRLLVGARDPGHSLPSVGCRLSRSFF